MKTLERVAVEYAESAVNQAEGVTVSMLKEYAKDDFIAGAMWERENSKTIEMRDMLEELLLDLESEVLSSSINDTIRRTRDLLKST